MQNAIHNSKKPSNSSEPGRRNPNPSAPRSPHPGGVAHSGARGRGRKGVRRAGHAPVRHEVSAGGILFRVRSSGVEVFFIKDSFGRWTFPKGHQELGENLAQTAVREVREETGLTGLRYIAPVGKKMLRFRRDAAMIHKAVHYFLFEVSPDAKERFRTRAEVGEGRELIQEGKWVPMRQAFSVSGYKNSDHLLASAFRIIGGRRQKT